MKSHPFDIEAAENIVCLFTVVCRGETIRWTDSETDITVGTDTWTHEDGAQMSSAEFNTDGSVSNAVAELVARDDGPLSDADIAVGRYDGAAITIQCVDTDNLTESPAPFGSVFVGFIGSVKVDQFNVITITARGNLSKLRGDISEQYGVMCRADLGDSRCGVPILPPDIERLTAYVAGDPLLSFVRVPVFLISPDTIAEHQNLYWECTTSGTTASSQPVGYAGAIAGGTVTDGTAVFTARNAYLRAAEVDTILSPQSFTLTDLPDVRAIDEYYTNGSAIIRGGPYSGSMIPIRRWTESTLKVETWWPVSHMIEAGTLLEISPGCPKTEAGCNSFVWSFGLAPLGNIKRRRAEPFLPTRGATIEQA